MLVPRELFPGYAGLHQGGLIMLAGSDLVMTMLTVALAASVVRTRPAPSRQVTWKLTTRTWLTLTRRKGSHEADVTGPQADHPGSAAAGRTERGPFGPPPALTRSLRPNERGFTLSPGQWRGSSCVRGPRSEPPDPGVPVVWSSSAGSYETSASALRPPAPIAARILLSHSAMTLRQLSLPVVPDSVEIPVEIPATPHQLFPLCLPGTAATLRVAVAEPDGDPGRHDQSAEENGEHAHVHAEPRPRAAPGHPTSRGGRSSLPGPTARPCRPGRWSLRLPWFVPPTAACGPSSLPISRHRNLARQVWPEDAATSETCLPPGTSWP
jgi:hypothetical protein